MAVKVGMISLGCAKNQVDGELLMAKLKAAGYELTDDVAMADVAIVNTCGFIESAKKESIDEILELGLLKKEGRIKKLVATGCLSERYQAEIRQELPELDGLELATRIRERDGDAGIVILSNYEEYALPAYKVRPYDYIMKSRYETELPGALEGIWREQQRMER